MKAVVVGAGVAGLSLAARLAMHGFEVEVHDSSEKVGGKMYQYTNEDFLSWDTGPTLISLPDEIRNTFKEINSPCPELIPLLENCNLVFTDGTNWKLPLGKENIINFFQKIDKEISKQLEDVLNISKSIYDFAQDNLFQQKPPSFLSMGLKSFKSGFIFKNSKIALTPYSEVVDRYIKNNNLREFFYHFASYVGTLPSVAQGGILSIAHVELGSEIVFPKGGVYKIAEALYSTCLHYKVKFHFNSKIISAKLNKDILLNTWNIKYDIKGDIQDKNYDILVSNCDPFVASNHWLDEPSFKKHFTSKITQKEFTASESQFVILYDWLDSSPISHHVKIFPKSFKSSFKDVYLHKKIPEDPCVYLVWPHATDKSISPRVLFISAMAPNTQAEYIWDEKLSLEYSQRVLHICREKLQLPFNGKVFKTITPQELEQRADSLNGGIYSASPTKFNPSIKNLYFVGAGVHPGAGVTMVLKSARRIAEHIIKQHNTKGKN